MSEFDAKSVCILGRQPELGLAELESLYTAKHVQPINGAALLDVPAEDINFKRLGGTVKVARILAHIPSTHFRDLVSYLKENLPEHLQNLTEGKLNLGISFYGIKVSVPEINRTTLELKKFVKKSGRPVRVVPNKSPDLSSAQVLHNKLTHKGGWELVFIAQGQNTILAQTLFVQDIEAYAARDQARPARDARVGMLPPKLAQIIINLAMPGSEIKKKIADLTMYRLLDPFCGSGVVLQEALLMGYSVYGSDIDERMVDYSTKNVQWLVKNHPRIEGQVVIERADATKDRLPGYSSIASELYLGKPLKSLPPSPDLKQVISGANDVVENFLRNLSSQQKNDKHKRRRKISLAVPAWRQPNGEFIHLPVIAKLTDMGYNIKQFKHVKSDDLLYYREDQIVARQLIVLERKL